MSGVEHKGTQTSTQRIKRIKHKKQNKIKKAAGDSGKNTNQKLNNQNPEPTTKPGNRGKLQIHNRDTKKQNTGTK